MFKYLILIIPTLIIGCSDKYDWPDYSAQFNKDMENLKDNYSYKYPLKEQRLSGSIIVDKESNASSLDYDIEILANHKININIQTTKNGVCTRYISEQTLFIPSSKELLISNTSQSDSFGLLEVEQNPASREVEPALSKMNNIYLHFALNVPEIILKKAPCYKVEGATTQISQNLLQQELDKTVKENFTFKTSGISHRLLFQSNHVVYLFSKNIGLIFNLVTFEPVGVSVPASEFIIGKKGSHPYVDETQNIHTVLLTSEDTDLRKFSIETIGNN